MDIVNFWQKQIDLWNEENKCSLCWEFSAPLVTSQINIVQPERCCVNVFLTDIRFREEKTINPATTMVTSKRCIWSFNIYALISEPLGVNNYNEIKGYDTQEGKWAKIFYPVIECLGCDNILDYCEILGYKINVTQNGEAQLIHNYLDRNYNGWRISYSFNEGS